MTAAFFETRHKLGISVAQLTETCRVARSVVLKQWDKGHPIPPEALFLIREKFPALAKHLEGMEIVLARLDFEPIHTLDSCLRRLGLKTLSEARETLAPLGYAKFQALAEVISRDTPDRAIYATYISRDAGLVGQLWADKFIERLPLPPTKPWDNWPAGGYSNRYWVTELGKARVALTYWMLRDADIKAGRIQRVTTDEWGEEKIAS